MRGVDVSKESLERPRRDVASHSLDPFGVCAQTLRDICGTLPAGVRQTVGVIAARDDLQQSAADERVASDIDASVKRTVVVRLEAKERTPFASPALADEKSALHQPNRVERVGTCRAVGEEKEDVFRCQRGRSHIRRPGQ
jgi:hypothetical protein